MHVFVISLGSVLFVVLREKQVLLNLFLRKSLNFYIVNVAVIYKGQTKKICNFKIKWELSHHKMCRKNISSILCSFAHACRRIT